MFNINFCWWLDSNCRPLELEATALSTEPQPLPGGIAFYNFSFQDISDWTIDWPFWKSTHVTQRKNVHTPIYWPIDGNTFLRVFFKKKNGPTPASFHVFSPFQTHFTANMYVKKCPSRIRSRDSNSQPLEHESPLITTRPGLLPKWSKLETQLRVDYLQIM